MAEWLDYLDIHRPGFWGRVVTKGSEDSRTQVVKAIVEIKMQNDKAKLKN